MDPAGKPIRVRFWKQMCVKVADWLTLCVIRVERPQAADTKRDPRISWFVWIGDEQADLVTVGQSYVHRFSQEHGYRFDKQSLFWADVRVRTPAQFERWSWVVAIVHNLLVLARDLAGASLRPWENHQREPTLQQVRRAMGKLLPQLGTPCSIPTLAGKIAGTSKRDSHSQSPALSARSAEAKSASVGAQVSEFRVFHWMGTAFTELLYGLR